MSSRNEVTQMIEPIVVGKVELPKKVSSYFGENTFSEMIMQKMLSERTFKAFKSGRKREK